jgi:hypothetical protein
VPARHLSLGHERLILLLEGFACAGALRCRLEDAFQSVVIVAIETACRLSLRRLLHSAIFDPVLGAGPSYHRQPAVGPELSLRAEAVRRIYRGNFKLPLMARLSYIASL